MASTQSTAAFPSAFPDLNALDRYRVAIATELARIANVAPNLVYAGLDRASTLDFGDLVFAVPRLRVKGIKPQDLAQKLACELKLEGVQPAVVDDIYLRFFFSPSTFMSSLLPQILTQGARYGLNPNVGLRDPSDPSAGRKRMIVEFSSPNIAKKFHAGHLRSTIIGGFLANLFQGSGYDVVRMNYLGDWGRQYGLLACGWQKYGSEEEFARDPIDHLFQVYVKINGDFAPEEEAYKAAKARGEDTAHLENQGLLGEAKRYFARMEEGDQDALALWRRFRDISIQRYRETYARLNIHFDEYSGESQVGQETMGKAEEILKEKGVAETDKGAEIIDFGKHGAKKLGVAIVRNRNGTSNYLLRDVGAAMQRMERYGFDEMLYVVMAEQEQHLKCLFKVMELMGGEHAEKGKGMRHVSFGKVAGMSTRKGTVKFLDDIISDVGGFMHDVMRRNEKKYREVASPEDTAEMLGISAIMVQDMSGKRANNYEYSLERMTAFEGDTGPYLQYAHARLCSIFRKIPDITHQDLLGVDAGTLLGESPHAVRLARIMALYPDMVNHALKTLEPATILTYLFRLTHELSSSYDHLKVVNPEEGREMSIARAALYEAARQTLRNGMVLLGLTPVDRM
ncbi:arginyl-tRNA synthetase [Diplogelasinospora grovesii]|uniref:arginine--tRNA ligase n=1 Tax=Diplogelasinospora grovesii TaxID=303347 RepID=A0AAN6N065_9PEZI|nr:arginyl-tRNA synthetase [Diplogelasinospora grovesii]